MKLYLARHAETNYNILKLANADPSVDVHLSETGVKQAENLAEQLKDVAFDVIYISELPRTRQTADIINKYHNKELIPDGRINDNKTGYEGKLIPDWIAALDASEDRWSAIFNDGESLEQASERARDFIDFLRTQDYDAVLVVTHGFMTQSIYAYLEHKTLDEAWDYKLTQGTYAEFDI